MAKNAATTKKTAVKKVVKMPAKTVKAAATTAKTAKPKAEKATSGKYLGKTSGLRVQAFQDKLMKDNYKAKQTDVALAKAMRAEFPNAVAFTEAHVAGIRSQWNNGKRPSQEGAVPAKRLSKFDDEGNEVNPRAGRKAGADKGVVKKGSAKKAAKAAPVEEDEDEDVEDEDVEDEDESEDEDSDDE